MLGSPIIHIRERRVGMRRYEDAFGDAQAGEPAPRERYRDDKLHGVPQTGAEPS